MKAEIKNKIKNIESLNDFLNFLQNEYKSKECKPGTFIKSTLIYFIADLCKRNNVEITNFENLKNKCIETENIYDFIETIKTNLKQNFDFSYEARKELLYHYITKICLIINLQEK